MQDQAEQEVSDLVDETADAERRLTFVAALIPAVYTVLTYLALVAALALVANSDATSLTSLGAVILVMLRSLKLERTSPCSSSYVGALIVGAVPPAAAGERFARYHQGRQHDGGRPIGTGSAGWTSTSSGSPTFPANRS